MAKEETKPAAKAPDETAAPPAPEPEEDPETVRLRNQAIAIDRARRAQFGTLKQDDE